MSFAAPGVVMPTPPVISIVSPWSTYWAPVAASAAAPTSSTGNAAFDALYIPFQVTTPATFTRGFWWNGSVPANAGNVSVAIYDTAGTRLATTGAVAASGASVIQSAAFTASVALQPGTYYMGMMLSTGAGANAMTAYSGNLVHGKASGMYRQAVGSSPMPATATFATWTAVVVPVFGVTTTSFAI